MKNNKKIYITWFLILILPAILIKVATYSGEMALSEDLALSLTFITRIGMIIITIWYGLKVGIKNIWAWVLGLSTLLPFMTWISLIILLMRKKDEQIMSNQNSQQSSTDHNEGLRNLDIRKKLEEIYIPMFEMLMSMSSLDAKNTFNDLYNEVVEESKKEGTINLPVNLGDELLVKENSDEKIKKMLAKKRNEGVIDEDIKWWWNMHDHERRMMSKVDDMFKTVFVVNELENSKANNKKLALEEAIIKSRKFNVIYGDPDDTAHTTGDDRPLSAELKDRINIYIEKRAKKDPLEYKKEIEASSTFNALIRSKIQKGEI